MTEHCLTPTDDDPSQTQRMKDLGIFTVVRTEIGRIIVADVDRLHVAGLLQPNGEQLAELIRRPIPQAVCAGAHRPLDPIARAVLPPSLRPGTRDAEHDSG